MLPLRCFFLAFLLTALLPAQRRTAFVKVLDAQGKPAVGVSLRVGWKEFPIGKTLKVTDAQGIGSIEYPANFRKPLSVWPYIAGTKTKGVRIEDHHATTRDKPLLIRLPPTGSIDITIVDSNGKRSFTVQGMWLQSRRPGYLAPTLPLHQVSVITPWLGAPVAATLRKNGCRFHYVGLGTEKLRVGIGLAGIADYFGTTIARPQKPGETLELEIQPKHLFEPRLVDSKGAPLANREVGIEVERVPPKPGKFAFNPGIGPPGLPSFRQTTDVEGRVRLFLRPELFLAEERATFKVSISKSRFGGPIAGGLTGHKQFQGRSPDLQRVVINRTSIAIAGTLIDEQGKPLPGIYLWLSMDSAKTDDMGRFELRGPPGRDHPVARLQLKGFVRHAQKVVYGDTRARIQLVRAASARGGFESRPPLGRRYITMRLIGRGRNKNHQAFFSLGWNDYQIEGEFIPPGTYDVQFFAHRSMIHEVKDVVMVAGETNRDPRLQKIPWSRLLVRREIHVVDQNNRPLPGCRVIHWRFIEDISVADDALTTDADGKVTAQTPKGEPHYHFQTKDGRVIRRDDITKDTTVVIGPRREIEARLQGNAGLPKGYWLELRWQVAEVDRKRDPWMIRPYQIRHGRGATRLTNANTKVSLPGAIPLDCEVRLRFGEDARTEVVASLGQRIPLDAKKLPIRWDAAAGAKALARLRARLER